MEKIPSVIENVLQILADKFGKTGEFLWKAILKQQYIDGITHLIEGFIFTVILIFSLVKALNYVNPNGFNDDFGPTGWWVLSIFALFPTIILIETALGELINPEYAAINYILDKFKKN